MQQYQRVSGEDISTSSVVAAVLDTSYYDSGHINLVKIRQLAQGLSVRGAELWVPEQVILEWAVHARGALTDLLQARKRMHKAP